MGCLLVCGRCGRRASVGVPGHGIYFRADELAKESFKGKQPTREEMERRRMEICKRLESECLERQRQDAEGDTGCRTLLDILLFKNYRRPHIFHSHAAFD